MKCGQPWDKKSPKPMKNYFTRLSNDWILWTNNTFCKDNCLAVVARGYNKDINFTILSQTIFILLNVLIFLLNEAYFLCLFISLVGFNNINKKLQYMFENWIANFFGHFSFFLSMTSVCNNFDDKSFCWVRNSSEEIFSNLKLLALTDWSYYIQKELFYLSLKES